MKMTRLSAVLFSAGMVLAAACGQQADTDALPEEGAPPPAAEPTPEPAPAPPADTLADTINDTVADTLDLD